MEIKMFEKQQQQQQKKKENGFLIPPHPLTNFEI